VLARSLRDDLDVAIRKEAAWSLGKLKDEGAVPHLLAALTDTGEVRRLAAGALGELGENIRTPDLQERSLNALIDLLVDPYLPGDAEISVMGMAAFALGEIGDRQAVSALIKAVDSPSGHLRMLATRALGKIGDPAAVPALIACLEDTFSPGWSEERVCDIAAAGLSDINTAEAQAALERWSTRLE
jgi:HEAT repeat protein